ncbi:MAG: DUF2171 domain-containing protein [Thermomicrobiales bacterium]|nr:DUF2171 domain-containing protein [Thermomicrobiales bacterium]
MERFADATRQHHLQMGASVFGTDGGKIGKVKSWDDKYLVIEKGLIFSSDYYIPFSAVANYTEEEVFLTVTKDEVLNSGWDHPPAAGEDLPVPDETEHHYVSGAFSQNAYEVDPKLPPRIPS